MSILESCTNAAAALMAASLLLLLAFVGPPAVVIVLVVAWSVLLSSSGVEFDGFALRQHADTLVSVASFFGIILGTFFGVALSFGLLAEMLKEALRWKLSR